jgi:hypothetical protein
MMPEVPSALKWHSSWSFNPRQTASFMAPGNCAEGTGLMLISGDRARHAALQGALQAMTGTLVYLGPQPERAAALRFARKVRLRRCAAQPFWV